MAYSQKYVILVAYSGSGKTYMGDYLELYHNFAHIDGDMPLHDPQYAEITKRFVPAFKKHWFAGEEVPNAADWQDYYKVLCDQAKEAGKTADRVVITQSAYRKEARLYMRDQLGADDVLLVQLDVDLDVLIKGLQEREEKIFPSYFSKTFEECWKDGKGTPLEGAVEKWGEFNGYESFKKYKQGTNIRGFVPVESDEGKFAVIDGSKRDNSVLDSLCKLLDLTSRAEEADYEKINGAQSIRLAEFKKDRKELFKDRALDQKAKEAKYVILIAYSGAGKTYMGDYLGIYHNFAHIDGDMPLHNPAHKDVASRFGPGVKKHWFAGEEMPNPADWQDFYKILCDEAKEAGKTSDRVVITQSAYRKEGRAYMREQLGPDNVLLVQLEVDKDVIIKGLQEREEKIFPSYFSASFEDCWKEGKGPLAGAVEKWGEYNGYESFRKYKLGTNIRGLMPLEADEGHICTVDGSKRDNSVLDAICKLLGFESRAAEADWEKINGAQAVRLEEFKKDRKELFKDRGEAEKKKEGYS